MTDQRDITAVDWAKAENHLAVIELLLAHEGCQGQPALEGQVWPLRDRVAKGERTPELYDAIMGLEV